MASPNLFEQFFLGWMDEQDAVHAKAAILLHHLHHIAGTLCISQL